MHSRPLNMFPLLNYRTLNDIDEEGWSLTTASTSYFWLFIIIIVLLGVAMVTLGAYKYHWFGSFRPRQQTANEPTSQDAIEMPPLSPAACATILNAAQFLDP